MIISRTPFRVSFFGGGTDYPDWYEKNEGEVISATINKYAYITVRSLPPFFDYKHRIQYFKKEEVKFTDEIEHPVVREAMKYLSISCGLEIVHSADLPARSGLGSSSTFTVGLLHALRAFQHKSVTKRELALAAIELEQKKIGESVGSQDQTAAAFGGLNLIKFNNIQTFEVRGLNISSDRLKLFQDHLLLCFTGFSRTAEIIAKSQIEAIGNSESQLLLMLDILKEAKSVLYNDSQPLEQIGSLLAEQWYLKKNLTDKISNPFIDEIYEEGINSGAIGGKLLGAGGGGFMLFFAKPEFHDKIKAKLSKKLFVPFRFEHTGSQIIYYSHD